MKKFLLVLIAIASFRLFVSCCKCSDETTPMHFNKVTIVNLDMEGDYNSIVDNPTDTMTSSKVAFEIIVCDSTIDSYIHYTAYKNTSFGFSTALATTCDCYQLFKPQQQIVDIKIYSLFRISEAIEANTEVTKHFVCLPSESRLYSSIDNLYPIINKQIIAGAPQVFIDFFCKIPIENEIAQFVVNIELSDGRMLSAYTNELKIIADQI